MTIVVMVVTSEDRPIIWYHDHVGHADFHADSSFCERNSKKKNGTIVFLIKYFEFTCTSLFVLQNFS